MRSARGNRFFQRSLEMRRGFGLIGLVVTVIVRAIVGVIA
jgi:hypothetical protein